MSDAPETPEGPDADAALRALARLRAEQDERHALAVEAGDDPRLAPPDAAEQDDFLAALLGETTAEVAPPPPAQVLAFPARPVARPARPATRPWRWAVPAAMAAGVLAFVATRRTEPLPVYALTAVQAGAQALRAEPAVASWSMVPGTRFDLVLKPAAPVATPMRLTAFVATGEALTPFTPEVEADAGGAFRVRGVTGVAFSAAPGEHAFVFALTPADRAADAAVVRAARGRPGEARDLLLIEHPFHIPAAAPDGGPTP
jgi:hypothetical protein